MQIRNILALSALAFGVAGPALAQEATVEPTLAVGQASRADVQAQALAALRAGELHESRLIDPVPPAGYQRTRAQVHAETLAALRSGEIDRLHAQAWSFADRLPPTAAALHMASGPTRNGR
jgi:hypothetical protein